MPKKKKYPSLKNGFGSIRHLSGHRTNPYAVFAPSTLGMKGATSSMTRLLHTALLGRLPFLYS